MVGGGAERDGFELNILLAQYHPLLHLLETFEYVINEVSEILKRLIHEPSTVTDQLCVFLWDGVSSAIFPEGEPLG